MLSDSDLKSPFDTKLTQRTMLCVHLDMQWQHEDHFKNGTAGNLRVRIVVDDPDSLFEEYRIKGLVSERNPVRNTSWGTREFGFRDLDGNGLIFYRDI